LYAFLIHEDYRDYFQRQGYSFAVTQELNRYVKGGLEFRRDFYDSLQTNTDWALFGGNKKFRNNPFINDGDMSSLVGMLVIDTRDNIRHTMRGTYLSLEGETSSSGLGGDFSFNRYLVDVRKYFELSRRENLDFRLRVGTTEGNVPIQKSFTLGGIGSLRGYNLKEFTGNRMVLGTVEYRIGLFRHGFMGFFDRLILFVDSGRAWDSSDNRKGTNGFEPVKFDFLKTDAGIGFSNESGSFRVDLARRTDVKNSHLNVFLRIYRPF
jgi:outer membrane protein insertion porin family